MSTALRVPRACGRRPRVLAIERVAHAAARRAGTLIRARHRERQEVSFKSTAVDLVTQVDREAEALIVGMIREAFPDHAIVAEESESSRVSGGPCWYIDPIDGTTNFTHGYPVCAVSIALAEGEELRFGLVHDPLREETFSAVKGDGARLNGFPIGVSEAASLDQALLGTGFPYDRRERADFYLAFVGAALRRARDIRRAGSAALDLCYVACGRLDGYWEWNLHAWDTAAGAVILTEAGGRITDFSGSSHRLGDPDTAASNGRIHDELLQMLGDVRRRVVAETNNGG
jgi:myo-inositol-1(or 4)-monophosphatase